MKVGFGPTERWHEREDGVFFCPACGSERQYLHRQSRVWIRIIVPVIPRQVLEETFECRTCHREFDEHVLTSPPTSDLTTRLQRVTRAASVLAMLDGDPQNEAARTTAVDVVRGVGLRHYSETDLDADLRSIDVSLIHEEAQQLTIDLDFTGRERLVLDVGHVAIAAGELSPANRAMIDELGRSLELSPGVVHRLLAGLTLDAASAAAFARNQGATRPANQTEQPDVAVHDHSGGSGDLPEAPATPDR